jgi:hypothetical protein
VIAPEKIGPYFGDGVRGGWMKNAILIDREFFLWYATIDFGRRTDVDYWINTRATS